MLTHAYKYTQNRRTNKVFLFYETLELYSNVLLKPRKYLIKLKKRKEIIKMKGENRATKLC